MWFSWRSRSRLARFVSAGFHPRRTAYVSGIIVPLIKVKDETICAREPTVTIRCPGERDRERTRTSERETERQQRDVLRTAIECHGQWDGTALGSGS